MPLKPKALSPSMAITGLPVIDRGGDGEAHADAHDPPGAHVQALARLVHVDDGAREVERVGAFVDHDGVRAAP